MIFKEPDKQVVMIGAGPAGLTAAYELCKAGVRSIVLERDSVVGGLARTVNYKGYHFDIGGHRFFTKVKQVEDMWREVLIEDDFLRCKRLSRIYYNNKFFYYPLRALDALFGLGILNSVLILASYCKAKIFPKPVELTFEDWVCNRFGRRLFEIFFKTYTEKVWGIPCDQISADWAAQRIQGLSLLTALKNALIKRKVDKHGTIKTLIDEFDYPRLGPGMMWETVADLVRIKGGDVRLGAGVEKIRWSSGKIRSVEVKRNGMFETVSGTDFISTMPIKQLIEKFEPAVPRKVLEAARSLHYRDFLTVALVVDRANVFPDNWIYVHDPSVRMSRIQNYKNWSSEMVPDPNKTCLGLEYFCFENDGLWTMSDAELKELGKQELAKIGLIQESEVEDGAVVRMPKAYPIYDSTYAESLRVVREFLASISNLQLVGRNGMHKYNNQDHSMLTAMLAARNILGGQHNLWQVNAEQEYHEEVINDDARLELALLASTQPQVPEQVVVSAAA
jgi:protoporphyrinogen oxidase